MKLIFRDLTLPLLSFKCGPGIMAAASLGSGLVGSIGGSLIQGSYSSSNVDKQLGAQQAENQKNRDWQTQQAEINRQFQQNMLNQQNQFQSSLQGQQQRYNLESMAQQAKYNSPLYMKEQLQAANVNPQVYFGNHASFGGSSVSSGGAPSAPSAPSGSMPGSVGGLSPVGYQPPNLQIGQILKDFAEARKSMAQTKTEDLMRDPMYKEVISKVKNQELVNEYQQLANFVFDNTKNAKIQHAFVELSKAQKDCILADDQHSLNAAEKRYKESLVALNRAAEALQGNQALLYGFKADTYFKDFESELAVRRSEINRNYASANEANTRAVLNQSEAKVNEFVAKIKESESDFTWSMLHNELEGLKRDNLIKDEQLRAAEAAADIAKVNASHAEELFWKDFIGDIVQQGFNAFLGYRNMRSWERLSSASQQNASRKIEEMKWKYGDSFTDTYKKTDADGRVHTYSVNRHSNFNKYSK